MDQASLKQIFQTLKKRMSLLDVEGLRESRKIEGLYAYDQEVRGFTNIMIYLDQGLSIIWEEIADILAGIDQHLGSYHNDLMMRYLFSFGGSEGILNRHAHTHIRRMTLEKWQLWTKIIDNVDSTPEDLVIPALFTGKKFGSGPWPGKKDLLIFFSRNRQVTMPEKVMRQYSFLKGNALWFFLESGHFEWEFGKFMPYFNGSSESNDIHSTNNVQLMTPVSASIILESKMDNSLVQQFAKKYGWSEQTLSLAIETKFRCAYCDLDFLESVNNYDTIEVDHIIPRNDDSGNNDSDNLTIACRTCNKLKRRWDPRSRIIGNDARRDQLIAAARSYVQERRQEKQVKVDIEKIDGEKIIASLVP